MKKQIINMKKIVGYLAIIIIFCGFIGSIVPASAYYCKPGDTECEEVKANMEQKQAEAYSFLKKADSVGELVDQLTSEIAEINKTIASNEAKIKELNIEIKATEEKLKSQQTALAELLINMHFSDDSEPIRVLAGSKSISDYAEKAAREEVAKREVVIASEKVKETKDQLNKRKEEVEQTLKANENERAIVAKKRESQKVLMAQYEKNADDASTVASYWEDQLKLLAWTPPANTIGFGSRWYGVPDTYPYRGRCPHENLGFSAYGGAGCQCTSYASWKAYEAWDIPNSWGGHAYNYENAAGYYVPRNGRTTYVNSIPAAKTIAVLPGTADSPWGHVMWVESINGDGTINITEYNVDWWEGGCVPGGFCSRKNVGTSGMQFVHFD